MSDWDIVYEKAIRDDGTLFFPERLTQEFLDRARRTMGSYLFANQYQNEVIPEDAQTFKKHWFKYFAVLPSEVMTFAFIDPAISEADSADFTGTVVISVDADQNWYVRYAQRVKMNPSALVDSLFTLYDKFLPELIGIEDVAFQRAIVYFAHEEMKRRGRHIPLMGVKRSTDKSKETRILGLVPRFEWGSLLLSQGLHDLEMELLQFPRGLHDDLIDSLASFDSIVSYPQRPRLKNEPPAPNDPKYEGWYIQQLLKRNERQIDD